MGAFRGSHLRQPRFGRTQAAATERVVAARVEDHQVEFGASAFHLPQHQIAVEHLEIDIGLSGRIGADRHEIIGAAHLHAMAGVVELAGSADTVLVLSRTRAGTVLYGRGRDIEDIEKAVQFDRGTCTWAILGNASSVQYSGARAAVLTALRETGTPMSLADIAAAVSLKANNVRQLLLRLVRDGIVGRKKSHTHTLRTERTFAHTLGLSILFYLSNPKVPKRTSTTDPTYGTYVWR
jgi:hypothetical protein